MLWTHQQEAVDWARGRRSILLHMGMGTGKTRTALTIINQMLVERSIRRILVGCPKAVIPAWAKQASLWLPGIRVVLLDKAGSAAKGAQVTAAMADTSPVIIVGNYESLWRIREIEKVAWDAVIWDEIHRLKSHSGAASKWAAKLVSRNPQCIRIGLSGTLLAHSPLDGFGVWRAVESPECPTFGTRWGFFKDLYAITNAHIPGMVVGWRNKEQFAKKVAETTFMRRSEDVLDLPAIHHIDVPVELTAKEANVYTQLEKEFCADVDDGRITPANAMVGLLRMLQACSGHMRLDDEVESRPIDDNPSKKAALRELLEDLDAGARVVVFCRFRADIDAALAVCQDIGLGASELSGRIDRLADWQAGRTSVLVAQIKSGGVGIDCSSASVGVFFSVGHSLSDWLQAIARIHRPGQTKTTRFFSLVSILRGKTTADGRCFDALLKRQEVIDAIVTGYREAGRSPRADRADRQGDRHAQRTGQGVGQAQGGA